MSQVDSASFATLVQKHIQELRNHSHVQQIIPVKPLVYKVVYWPKDLDSLYSEMVYNLKLTIPQSYPQKPPHLIFLDKIYHLNVHPNSGQVFMSILRDDWSPFLNLRTVISSLDQVLQQPDEENAATTNLLEEYQQDINTYVQNVKATIEENMNQDQNKKHSQTGQEVQEVVEQVIQVNDFDYDEIKKKGPQNNILIQDGPKQAKISLKIGKNQKQQYSFTQSGQIPQSPRSAKSQKQSNTIISPRQNSKSKQSQKPQGSQKKISLNKVSDEQSFARYEDVVKQSKIILNPNDKGSSFDGLKTNMIRCKQLINIFTGQLNELQQSLQKNKGSKRIKKLFEDRCTKVQDMIIQLFDISQKTRLKLMDTVRKDFNKYK